MAGAAVPRSSGLVGTAKDPNAKPDVPVWRRRGAIIALIHDLGAALGFAILLYYLINGSIFFFTELSFKVYALNRVYGEIYDEQETFSKKRSITCCWDEKRKYNLFKEYQRDNLDAGLTLVELLTSQRVVKKLVQAQSWKFKAVLEKDKVEMNNVEGSDSGADPQQFEPSANMPKRVGEMYVIPEGLLSH